MTNTQNNINALIPRVYVRMGKESVLDWSKNQTFNQVKKLLNKVSFYKLMELFAKTMTSKELVLYKKYTVEENGKKVEKVDIYEKRTKTYILKCVNEYIKKMKIAYGSSETMKTSVSYRQLSKLVALSKKKIIHKDKYAVSCYCIIIFYVMFEKMGIVKELKTSNQVNNINTVVSKYYGDNPNDELAHFITDCVEVLKNELPKTIEPENELPKTIGPEKFPSNLNSRTELIMKRDAEIIAGVFCSVIAGIITEFINKGCITEQYIATKTTNGFSINTICEYNFWKTILSLIGVFLFVWIIIYSLICIVIPIINRIIKLIRIPKKKRQTSKEIVNDYFSIKKEFILFEKAVIEQCPLNKTLKLLHFTELCRIINTLYETLRQITPENESVILRKSNSISNINKYITPYDCSFLLAEIEKFLDLFVFDDDNFKQDFNNIKDKIGELKKCCI